MKICVIQNKTTISGYTKKILGIRKNSIKINKLFEENINLYYKHKKQQQCCELHIKNLSKIKFKLNKYKWKKKWQKAST